MDAKQCDHFSRCWVLWMDDKLCLNDKTNDDMEVAAMMSMMTREMVSYEYWGSMVKQLKRLFRSEGGCGSSNLMNFYGCFYVWWGFQFLEGSRGVWPRWSRLLLTSGERVHKWWLRDCGGGCGGCGCSSGWDLLRLANLGIALCKLQPNRLGQVGVETDALLQR